MGGKEKSRLTILSTRYIKETERTLALCLCSCGVTKEVRKDHVVSGKTISCGCYHREISPSLGYRLGKSQIRHGETNTRLHNIWTHMKQRCYDPNYNKFKYWGGRGIVVCPAWHKYENFRDWARSNGYDDLLTIDRVDNSKNYCPENCRWATLAEQSRNRSCVKK